ncbi:MAG: GNAT family N-acetyltransferase [Gammaproteobacteria bacterium]
MSESNPAATATVRRATAADAAALANLSVATFVETFGHLYPPEDLQEFLTRACSPDACRKLIEEPGNAVWLATFESPEPVAYMTVGTCKLPVENIEPAAGEIRQLYVLAKYHNLRLGTRLMTLALDWLATEGRAPLYVGVWSENDGAQRLYGRYGFTKIGEYGFRVGTTIDREFILKR